MATYRSAYQEDSDADDEYERSVITSPTLPHDHELSPTDSEPPSAEHTPTTFTHSADSYASPKGIINTWTPEQVADWISSLGLGQYAKTFLGAYTAAKTSMTVLLIVSRGECGW